MKWKWGGAYYLLEMREVGGVDEEPMAMGETLFSEGVATKNVSIKIIIEDNNIISSRKFSSI
jgi:hypothetical protein